MTQTPIRIEGFIGVDVTVASVRAQLQQAAPGTRPVVYINSDGGSCQEAAAIYSDLLAHPGGVDTVVSGWALSAATVVLMAGRSRSMHETSLLMVHAPWMGTAGNSEQLRQAADVLDQVAQTLRAAYRRTGRTDAQIAQWLDGQDHWFTSDEALRAGLVDQVVAVAEAPAAGLRREVFAACRFPVPQRILERIQPMTTTAAAPAAPIANADEIRGAAVRAEVKRQSDIRAAFAGYPSVRGLPGAQAALETWLSDPAVDLAQAKLKMLDLVGRDTTPLAGHYYVRDASPDGMSDFLAAATDTLAIRAGLRIEEPHPAARDLRRMSIVGMAERVLSMRGQSTAGRSPSDIISAALTTSDFPQLLSNVAGKSLRIGYQSAPATFRGWTGEREVVDFKEQTLVMLSEAPGLLEVKEAAEYKYGSFAESGMKFQAKTYGRILAITRQALINDDTSAFTTMPNAFGQAAVRLEADSVYGLLTSNPTLSDTVALFDAAHGNLSAAAAPSLASLGAARAAMRKQKGLQGLEFIDAQPRFIIAPVALETTFEQLLASLVDPSKSNDTPNVEWVRNLQLACDPRLDASSASVWYLATAPQQIEGIVRAYIAGEQRPYLEEKDEFTRDVVSMKSRLDLATGVVDFRALHRVG